MTQFAYLFERFPSFGQTFCYREVAELYRLGLTPPIFAIRRPKDEPPQDWDQSIVERVKYVPEEAELIPQIDRLSKRKELPKAIVDLMAEWGRRTDFLRLYQAIYVGSHLQKMAIDHVHVHFAGLAARTAFWIDRFFGIRFSFTGHANDIFAPRDFEISLDGLIGSASTVITVSDYAADFLKQRFPASSARIHRIYNGIDFSKFAQARFSGSIPSLITVGRLIEKKGFGDLIRACDLLKCRGVNFRCQIIGEGPLEKDLRAQIERLGLERNVALPGPMPQGEIASRLAAATVFVLACIAEKDGAMDNLPTVIMEAMASGLPIVSTPIGGIPEMVVNNQTGFLVRPGDPAALADATEKLTVDLPLAQKFGRSGCERAQQLFSIEKNVGELVALLRG